MKMLFLDKEKYEGLTKKAEALRDNLEQEEKKADDAYKELAQSIIPQNIETSYIVLLILIFNIFNY